MTQRKATIKDFVEQACAAETNMFGDGIWSHHITEVVRNSRELAPRFSANVEVVELAALLHDYASIKDEAMYAEHHIHGAHEAETILTQLEYSDETIDAVKRCILTHRASAGDDPKTPEAKCLASADAMAHIQQVPSLLYGAYAAREMDIDAGTEWVRSKLERSWEKLAPEVRPLVRDEYEAAQTILSNN
jgi:uncharacterized protein